MQVDNCTGGCMWTGASATNFIVRNFEVGQGDTGCFWVCISIPTEPKRLPVINDVSLDEVPTME
jgi:hypothetical protein